MAITLETIDGLDVIQISDSGDTYEDFYDFLIGDEPTDTTELTEEVTVRLCGDDLVFMETTSETTTPFSGISVGDTLAIGRNDGYTFQNIIYEGADSNLLDLRITTITSGNVELRSTPLGDADATTDPNFSDDLFTVGNNIVFYLQEGGTIATGVSLATGRVASVGGFLTLDTVRSFEGGVVGDADISLGTNTALREFVFYNRDDFTEQVTNLTVSAVTAGGRGLILESSAENEVRDILDDEIPNETEIEVNFTLDSAIEVRENAIIDYDSNQAIITLRTSIYIPDGVFPVFDNANLILEAPILLRIEETDRLQVREDITGDDFSTCGIRFSDSLVIIDIKSIPYGGSGNGNAGRSRSHYYFATGEDEGDSLIPRDDLTLDQLRAIRKARISMVQYHHSTVKIATKPDVLTAITGYGTRENAQQFVTSYLVESSVAYTVQESITVESDIFVGGGAIIKNTDVVHSGSLIFSNYTSGNTDENPGPNDRSLNEIVGNVISNPDTNLETSVIQIQGATILDGIQFVRGDNIRDESESFFGNEIDFAAGTAANNSYRYILVMRNMEFLKEGVRNTPVTVATATLSVITGDHRLLASGVEFNSDDFPEVGQEAIISREDGGELLAAVGDEGDADYVPAVTAVIVEVSSRTTGILPFENVRDYSDGTVGATEITLDHQTLSTTYLVKPTLHVVENPSTIGISWEIPKFFTKSFRFHVVHNEGQDYEDGRVVAFVKRGDQALTQELALDFGQKYLSFGSDRTRYGFDDTNNQGRLGTDALRALFYPHDADSTLGFPEGASELVSNSEGRLIVASDVDPEIQDVDLRTLEFYSVENDPVWRTIEYTEHKYRVAKYGDVMVFGTFNIESTEAEEAEASLEPTEVIVDLIADPAITETDPTMLTSLDDYNNLYDLIRFAEYEARANLHLEIISLEERKIVFPDAITQTVEFSDVQYNSASEDIDGTATDLLVLTIPDTSDETFTPDAIFTDDTTVYLTYQDVRYGPYRVYDFTDDGEVKLILDGNPSLPGVTETAEDLEADIEISINNKPSSFVFDTSQTELLEVTYESNAVTYSVNTNQFTPDADGEKVALTFEGADTITIFEILADVHIIYTSPEHDSLVFKFPDAVTPESVEIVKVADGDDDVDRSLTIPDFEDYLQIRMDKTDGNNGTLESVRLYAEEYGYRIYDVTYDESGLVDLAEEFETVDVGGISEDDAIALLDLDDISYTVTNKIATLTIAQNYLTTSNLRALAELMAKQSQGDDRLTNSNIPVLFEKLKDTDDDYTRLRIFFHLVVTEGDPPTTDRLDTLVLNDGNVTTFDLEVQDPLESLYVSYRDGSSTVVHIRYTITNLDGLSAKAYDGTTVRDFVADDDNKTGSVEWTASTADTADITVTIKAIGFLDYTETVTLGEGLLDEDIQNEDREVELVRILDAQGEFSITEDPSPSPDDDDVYSWTWDDDTEILTLTTDVVYVKSNFSVEQVLAHMRRTLYRLDFDKNFDAVIGTNPIVQKQINLIHTSSGISFNRENNTVIDSFNGNGFYSYDSGGNEHTFTSTIVAEYLKQYFDAEDAADDIYTTISIRRVDGEAIGTSTLGDHNAIRGELIEVVDAVGATDGYIVLSELVGVRDNGGIATISTYHDLSGGIDLAFFLTGSSFTVQHDGDAQIPIPIRYNDPNRTVIQSNDYPIRYAYDSVIVSSEVAVDLEDLAGIDVNVTEVAGSEVTGVDDFKADTVDSQVISGHLDADSSGTYNQGEIWTYYDSTITNKRFMCIVTASSTTEIPVTFVAADGFTYSEDWFILNGDPLDVSEKIDQLSDSELRTFNGFAQDSLTSSSGSIERTAFLPYLYTKSNGEVYRCIPTENTTELPFTDSSEDTQSSMWTVHYLEPEPIEASTSTTAAQTISGHLTSSSSGTYEENDVYTYTDDNGADYFCIVKTETTELPFTDAAETTQSDNWTVQIQEPTMSATADLSQDDFNDLMLNLDSDILSTFNQAVSGHLTMSDSGTYEANDIYTYTKDNGDNYFCIVKEETSDLPFTDTAEDTQSDNWTVQYLEPEPIETSTSTTTTNAQIISGHLTMSSSGSYEVNDVYTYTKDNGDDYFCIAKADTSELPFLITDATETTQSDNWTVQIQEPTISATVDLSQTQFDTLMMDVDPDIKETYRGSFTIGDDVDVNITQILGKPIEFSERFRGLLRDSDTGKTVALGLIAVIEEEEE